MSMENMTINGIECIVDSAVPTTPINADLQPMALRLAANHAKQLDHLWNNWQVLVDDYAQLMDDLTNLPVPSEAGTTNN